MALELPVDGPDARGNAAGDAPPRRKPQQHISGDNSMSKGQTLQDPFLNALRRERVPVSI